MASLVEIPVPQHAHVMQPPAPLPGHEARCALCGFGLRHLLDTQAKVTIVRPGFERVESSRFTVGKLVTNAR